MLTAWVFRGLGNAMSRARSDGMIERSRIARALGDVRDVADPNPPGELWLPGEAFYRIHASARCCKESVTGVLSLLTNGCTN